MVIEAKMESVEAGMLVDFISGLEVRDTPEEREAVQVLARRLVHDYGYPAAHLHTRPQWRVRSAPSRGKRFPIDIAVFSTETHSGDQLFMVCECKRENRKDGIAQLKTYLDMSSAEVGVWFNGADLTVLQKVITKDGRKFVELPDFPRYGQAIADIGKYKRRDLTPASNLRAVFRTIRNHLAANASGITRDEALAQQIINLLFCKLYDEVQHGPDDDVEFRYGPHETPTEVARRVKTRLFEPVKDRYADVFDDSDTIKLDVKSLAYVVGQLQNYCIQESSRDAIGDAFEVFIGPALRGAEGQFFTPRNVVNALVTMVDPQPDEYIIDPACGSGGFLTVALEHVWLRLESEAITKGWDPATLALRKHQVAADRFRGLDKDDFLARCTKAYLAILGDGRGEVFRVDSSLQPPAEWPRAAQEKIKLGSFDVVLTNPPFGKKIRVAGEHLLEQYELGYRWAAEATNGATEQTDALLKDQAPQLLFLERCIQLLKPGGRLGIILPESLFGSPSYAHIIEWMHRRTVVLAVAALPEPLFKTSGKVGTHTKTCMVVLQKKPIPPDLPTPPKSVMFMADAKWCGHNSRGNPTIIPGPDGKPVILDDLPDIARRYRDWADKGRLRRREHLGFTQPRNRLVATVLVPRYYDPEIQQQLNKLKDTHELRRIGDLIDAGQLKVTTGVEIGKMAYGTGTIPFIRTSDLSNWELKADPKHGVSAAIYRDVVAANPDKFDVTKGDILMVKDGTYLIGTSAVVTDLDTKILYQSHLYRIRVLDTAAVDPWLLFAALNSPIAKRQIRAKRFTQDIIDTLGNRLGELVLPFPRDCELRTSISKGMQCAITKRAELREEARKLTLDIEGSLAATDIAQLNEVD
jgi:type I restriction enzyme M protein